MIRRIAVAALSLVISSGAFADVVNALKPDTPTKIGAVEAVCTGVGLGARQNAAWNAYPLKIEIAGRGGQYLGDIRLALSKNDTVLAVVTCDGPWILLKTQPGAYRVEVGTEGQTASSNAYVLAEGRGRVVVRFPMLGGDVGSKPAPAEQTPPPVKN